MKAIKSYALTWFIGFTVGIATLLTWQHHFEIIPKLLSPYSPVQDGDIRGLAWEMARRYHLDVTLLFAIIDQESQWNPNAISPKGAIGLMQIMPETGEVECGLVTREQLLDPKLNLECGTTYFSHLLKHFGSVRLALCAYNAGPNRVAELGRCPQLQETTRYTKNILTAWQGGK